MRQTPPLGRDIFLESKRGGLRGVGRRGARGRTNAAAVEVPGGDRSAGIARERREELIRDTIAKRSLETHFQPIVDLRTGRPVGAEALSRFGDLPSRAPDEWFADAASVGLGVELERIALESALEQIDLLPPGVYLSLNASFETMMTDAFHEAIAQVDSERIVVELTEHTRVRDYELLARKIEHLRSRGVRVAVDDAGAGYSGLTHILNLRPDVIKLDISLTRGIDRDPARRALGRALLAFGLDAYNASFVAEGIETEGEFETLRTLGCPTGQGFFLGRPALLAARRVRTLVPPPSLIVPGGRPESEAAPVDQVPAAPSDVPERAPVAARSGETAATGPSSRAWRVPTVFPIDLDGLESAVART